MYGREIGAHFHLTLGRTVFSPAKGGFWSQHASERDGEAGKGGEAEASGGGNGAGGADGTPRPAAKKGCCHCCWRPLPALPSGQKAYTALWRLDKLVVVPYHEQYADVFGVRNEEALHTKARLGAQNQRHTLIQALQGPATAINNKDDGMLAFEGIRGSKGDQDVLRATLDSVARFNSSLPWNKERDADKASSSNGEWWANVFGRRKIEALPLHDAASQNPTMFDSRAVVADIEAPSSSRATTPPGTSLGASEATDARSV